MRGNPLDRCVPPSEGQIGRNFPFKQKLDMDLNVKSENPQLIGKKYILHMQDIWLHICVKLSIQIPFHTILLDYFLELHFDVWFKQRHGEERRFYSYYL